MSGCQRRSVGTPWRSLLGNGISAGQRVVVFGLQNRRMIPTPGSNPAPGTQCCDGSTPGPLGHYAAFRHWPFDDRCRSRTRWGWVGAGDVPGSRGIEGDSLGRHSGRDGSARLVNGAVTRGWTGGWSASRGLWYHVVALIIHNAATLLRRWFRGGGVRGSDCAGSTGAAGGVGSTLVMRCSGRRTPGRDGPVRQLAQAMRGPVKGSGPVPPRSTGRPRALWKVSRRPSRPRRSRQRGPSPRSCGRWWWWPWPGWRCSSRPARRPRGCAVRPLGCGRWLRVSTRR